jgi:hypothetical protein
MTQFSLEKRKIEEYFKLKEVYLQNLNTLILNESPRRLYLILHEVKVTQKVYLSAQALLKYFKELQ